MSRNNDHDGSATIIINKTASGKKLLVLCLCVGLAQQARGVSLVHQKPTLHRRPALVRGQSHSLSVGPRRGVAFAPQQPSWCNLVQLHEQELQNLERPSVIRNGSGNDHSVSWLLGTMSV